PAPADVVQHGRRGARLALHLTERRPLGPAPEHDRRREEGEQEAQDAEIDGVPDQETDREEDTEGDDSDSREYKTDLLVGPAGHLVGQGDLLQSPGVRSVRCGFLPRHAPKSTWPRERDR